MKKFFTWFVIALFTFLACNEDTPKYQINGAVVGELEGRPVYLKQLDELRPGIIIDSAIIKNGTFTMEGNVATPYLYNISVGGARINFNLFIENKPIQVNIDADNPIRNNACGSPLNDLYTNYLNESNEKYQVKMLDFRKRLKEAREAKLDKILSAEEKRIYTKEEAELTNALRDYQYQFITNNPNSIVSAYILRTVALNLKPEKVEKAIALFDTINSQSYFITSVKSDLERMKKVDIGQKYIDTKLSDPNGNEISLSDYAGKGKYVLIDFWASWCPDCLEENPHHVKLYNKYKDKGFEIVGISLDRDKDAWISRIEKDKLSWVQMSDLKAWNSEAAYLYNIKYIPGTILLDKDGVIIAKNIYDEELAEKLAELLGK